MMAEDKKEVLMILPDGSQAYFPESNVKTAQERGAKLPETAPPPKGVAELGSAAVKQAKGAADTSGGAIQGAIGGTKDFLAGMGTAFTALPGQVMRLAGGDPSQVEIPFITQTTATGEIKPATLESIGKPPETMAGKTGEVVGEVLQIATGGGAAKGAVKYGAKALAKAPQLASLTTKAVPVVSKVSEVTKAVSAAAPKTAKVAEWASKTGANIAKDALVSTAVEYSKTGEAEKSLLSAEKGAVVNALLSAAGKIIPAVTKNIAQKTLPLITDRPDYHRALADRLISTASEFTEKGAREIENRFSGVVKSMKDASNKADYWLNQANALIASGKASDPSGVIPSNGRLIPFPQLLEKSFDDYIKGGKGLGIKLSNKVVETLEDIKKTLPTDESTGKLANLTFKEAEELKSNIQDTITGLYQKAGGAIDEEIQKQIRKLVADAMREGQRKGFDILKNAASKVKLPKDSGISNMRPWQIKLPGSITPVDYKQAGQIAMKDSDLLTIAKMHNLTQLPQARGEAGKSLMDAISVSQFAHGNVFTPSQVATAFKRFFTPGLQTKTVKTLESARKLGSVTSSAERAQALARALGERTAKPPSMTEWVQQQAAPTSQENQWTIEQ